MSQEENTQKAAASGPDEQIDVVNELDKFVMTLGRNEVHKRGLMHRSVHIFVMDPKERIYLQRRAWNKEQDPGRWDSSASGHVESGESYVAAAARELEEELGLALVLEQQFKVAACRETSGEHSMLFLGFLPDGAGTIEPNQDEILEGRFYEMNEIEAGISETPDRFAAAFRCIFRHFLCQGGQRSLSAKPVEM